MTDSDDRLAKRYRELSREMPPPALDREILAASRRAVAGNSRASRWAAPVSIAAVLVLAFGVTLQMQREEPQVATSVPAAPAPAPVATEAAPVARDANVAAPPPRALKKEVAPSRPRAEAKRAAQPQATADAVAPAPAAAPAAAAPAAGANAMQSFAREKTVAPPERELERIAKLRADGRHEEADKALEVFRREHPDYRIAEAMWERVKPR